MQAAVMVAPRRAHCRSTSAASRTSGLARAVSSGARHLVANGRNYDAIGRPLARSLNRDTQTLRSLNGFSHSDDPHFKSRNRQSGHFIQFVCGLKRVENSGDSEIKHAIESKDLYAHGNYGTKYGVLASSEEAREPLISD